MSAAVRDEKKKAVHRVATILGRGAQGETLARALVAKGVKTRAALRKPEVLRALPKDAQLNIMYPRATPISLAEADALVAELTRRLGFCVAPTRCLTLPLYAVGSVRRRSARIGDIDLLVHLPAHLQSLAPRVLNSAQLADAKPGDRATLMDADSKAERHRSCIVRWASADGDAGVGRTRPRFLRVDLFLVEGSELPFALYHYTGPRMYNIRIRALAKRKGWLLNQYGLFDAKTMARLPGTEGLKTEQDIMKFLGVTNRAPTER